MALLLYMVNMGKKNCTRREACVGYCPLTTMTLDGVIKAIDISGNPIGLLEELGFH